MTSTMSNNNNNTTNISSRWSATEIETFAKRFDQDGYVVVPGALESDHVDRLNATLHEMVHSGTLAASILRKTHDVLDGHRQVSE